MAQLRHVRGCFGCSTTNSASLGIVLASAPGGAEGRVRFGAGCEGAPGLVHGGLLATFADEVMGFVHHGDGAVRVTAEMTIRYRRPTPLDTDLVCRARAGEMSGRRFTVHAVITAAADDALPLADAEATYVFLDRSAEPSGAQRHA
jgi:acyl-coenzyme A thioesterase PaaI-like protein